jgi:hypothetical protein
MLKSLQGRYVLADEDGEYSADPGDYWHLADGVRFEGQSLLKLSHPYTTTTGRKVLAPRILKNDPTMRDLRRLAVAL